MDEDVVTQEPEKPKRVQKTQYLIVVERERTGFSCSVLSNLPDLAIAVDRQRGTENHWDGGKLLGLDIFEVGFHREEGDKILHISLFRRPDPVVGFPSVPGPKPEAL